MLFYGGLYRIIQTRVKKIQVKNVIKDGKTKSDLREVRSILRGLRGNLKKN